LFRKEKSKFVWSPYSNGLSVSGLELFLVDKTAFELRYLRELEPVEPWNKNTAYGRFIQAGIEGWIKTRERRGVSKFIDNEFRNQVKEYDEYEEISWWAQLAFEQTEVFLDKYAEDIEEYQITDSEKHHKAEIELPSGRVLKLHGYIDGEGPSIIMENKCRGEWDEEGISSEIHLNLQYNMYNLLFMSAYGKLPDKVWYQHIRRPGGFAYRGPRQKKHEPKTEYRNRIVAHMKEEQDYYFYRHIAIPTTDEVSRFCHASLYPVLEHFLDWYGFKVHPQRHSQINNVDWMTPYGLYNPFMEGTQERFRNYRLTGSTRGLRPTRRKESTPDE
jgi:hypothetical protein